MKTRIIITAAAILFSVTLANASSKQRSLIFCDALGRTLTMPMMAEEAAEATPFDTRAEFYRIHANDTIRTFDISKMLKEEKEEELPFDLDSVLKTIK